MITSIDELDLNKRYTYQDYLGWHFDERVELIFGRIYQLPSFPGLKHQRVSMALIRLISNFLYRKTPEIFHAPFDVRFPLQNPEKIDTVVQPDISIICDPGKIDDKGCNGAPDWIIEILSPRTASKDLNEKFQLYQHAGVQEYWVVHPHEGTLLVYVLNEVGEYQLIRSRPFVKGELVKPTIFPDLEVELADVFE